MDKENLDSKSGPNTNWVMRHSCTAQVLVKESSHPTTGMSLFLLNPFLELWVGEPLVEAGASPYSLCPYPGTDYLLDKPSCLPLQVLTSLLGSQGRTTCSDIEISGRPWGAIVVKLQRSAERMKTSKIPFV